MYKKRIHKWGLEKKNKEPEMKAIIRKEKDRGFQGKASLYRVRGRIVEYREAVRYWKRKRMSEDDVLALCNARDATPEALECFTPPPSPNSASAVLSMPERLLKTIADYCHGSFDPGTWYSTDATLSYVSIKDPDNSTDYLMRQLYAVRNACNLFDKERSQEAGKQLISCIEFTKEILLAKSPMTLQWVFDVMMKLQNRPEISTIIMRHSNNVPQTISLGQSIPQIATVLFTLASHPLKDVLQAARNSLADLFERRLGSSTSTTLDVRYAFPLKDVESFERTIRAICEDISRYEARLGGQGIRCLYIHQECYYDFSRLFEAGREASHILQVCQEMGPDRSYTDVYSAGLGLLSTAYFGLNDIDSGETWGREGIAFAIHYWGQGDPKTQDCMLNLEEDLRRAGRRESAEQIAQWRAAIFAEEEEKDAVTPELD